MAEQAEVPASQTPAAPPVGEAPPVEVKTIDKPVNGSTPTPPVEPPKVDEKKERASAKQFEALAKQAKLVAAEKKEIRDARAKVDEDMKKLAEHQNALKKAKENPKAALEALGIDYDYVTKFLLNEGVPTTDQNVDLVKEEIAKLRKEQADKEAAREAEELREQEESYDATYADFKKNTLKFVADDTATYELIHLYNQAEVVVEVIEQMYQQSGNTKILTAKQAADMVEKHLEEQVVVGKAAKKFAAQSAVQEVKKQGTSESPKPRTMSNAETATAPATEAADVDMSPEARKARGIAAFKAAKLSK